MSKEPRAPLEVNGTTRTIEAKHWGYTLRTLFGAALAASADARPGERRLFTVRMKGKPIATLYVQKHDNQD
jgi:hypothetical protein